MRNASLYVLVVLLIISTVALCLPASLVRVEVFPDGSAHVVYTFPTNGSAIIDLRLVGVPDPNLLVLVQNERGEPLPYTVNETSGIMTIIALNSTQVTVDYYTLTITSKIGGRWVVNFTTPLPAVVKLPANATLSALYVVPTSITTEGQSIVLKYPPGPIKLAYVLPPAVKATQPRPTPQTQPTLNETQAQKPLPQPEKVQPQSQSPYLLPYALIGIAVVVIVAFLILRRREAEGELSEVDTRILNVLKQSGGGLFQSELASMLGLPTTTVWRHIKKLESRGLVVVEKKAGRNFIRLARLA